MKVDEPGNDDAPPQRIGDGDVVAYRYLIRSERGQVLAASSEVVRYLQGGEDTFPRALSSKLLGRRNGESFTVTLSPDEAFGSRGGPRLLTLPRDRFSELLTLRPGTRVETTNEHGDELSVWVVEAREHEVVVDFDHPLAGRRLQFEVAILSIRGATASEHSASRADAPARGEAAELTTNDGGAGVEVGGLGKQLSELRAALVRQFVTEEGRGGLHEGIEQRTYGSTRRVREMQDTHAELLGSLDALADRVDDANSSIDHQGALVALLRQIAEHESSESALLQESLQTDFGGEA